MTPEQKKQALDTMTAKQKDLFQWLEFGCAGIVPGKTPGTWTVYDTSDSVEFAFDPRDLLGPMTAYPIPMI